MTSFLARFSTMAMCLLLMVDLAWAQATAQLNGRVNDESGAALPGAAVTATQTATGLIRTEVTNETNT